MSFLTGSAPKVVNTTQPTVDPQQAVLMQMLSGLLTSGTQPAGIQAYGGQFGAPTSGLQDTSLTGLANVAGAVQQPASPDQVAAGQGTIQALLQSLSQQAPQIGAPVAQAAPQVTPQTVGAGTVAAPQVAAPQINSAQAFQQGVAQPLIDNFNQQILPAISGTAARSAGGAYSSDTELARNLATTQLGRTLAQQGTLYDLGAQEANQQAGITTGLANQSAGLQAGTTNVASALQAALANQSSNLSGQATNQGATDQINLANLAAALTAAQGNQSADLTTAGQKISAIGQAPTAIGAPDVAPANAASILSNTLAGGGVPQQTQQTQLTGQYQDFLNQITQANTLRQLLASLSVSPTQQTLSVAQGGSTGLLQGLISALGPAAGAAVTKYG